MWDFRPLTKVKPVLPAVEAQSLNYWTCGEVPSFCSSPVESPGLTVWLCRPPCDFSLWLEVNCSSSHHLPTTGKEKKGRKTQVPPLACFLLSTSHWPKIVHVACPKLQESLEMWSQTNACHHAAVLPVKNRKIFKKRGLLLWPSGKECALQCKECKSLVRELRSHMLWGN